MREELKEEVIALERRLVVLLRELNEAVSNKDYQKAKEISDLIKRLIDLYSSLSSLIMMSDSARILGEFMGSMMRELTRKREQPHL